MKHKSALVTAFLITMGGDCVASDSIIKDIQPNYLEESKVHNNKLDNAYQKIYTELYSYKELADNWDGYGGVRPNNEIISTTKRFIDILKEKKIVNPKIMLSGTGEIGLFWKNKDNYIEVDFDEVDSFTFFYDIDNKLYGEDDVILSENIPSKLLYVLNSLHNKSSTQNTNLLTSCASSSNSIALTV